MKTREAPYDGWAHSFCQKWWLCPYKCSLVTFPPASSCTCLILLVSWLGHNILRNFLGKVKNFVVKLSKWIISRQGGLDMRAGMKEGSGPSAEQWEADSLSWWPCLGVSAQLDRWPLLSCVLHRSLVYICSFFFCGTEAALLFFGYFWVGLAFTVAKHSYLHVYFSPALPVWYLQSTL